MAMNREQLRELAIFGARERILGLEKEKQRLLQEFPELQESLKRALGEQRAEEATKPNGHRQRPAPGKKFSIDRQGVPKLLLWLREVGRPVRMTEVTEHFGLNYGAANQRLRKLLLDKLVKRETVVENNRQISLYHVTKRGEEAEVSLD
jgi:hypothetical protein